MQLQDSTGEPVPFETRWRSHSTAICRDWVAQQNSTASAKKSKNHLEPSVTLSSEVEPDSTLKRGRVTPSRTRGNYSPQRNLRLPEKTPCCVQILTFKSHPWCSSSNAICQEGLAKQNQNRNNSTLLFSTLLYLYTCSAATLPLPLPLNLLCFYLLPTLPLPLLFLFSTSRRYVFSTLPLLGPTLLYLYSTSFLLQAGASSLLYSTSTALYATLPLPLLYLFSASRRCQLDTMMFGLARMWLYDLLRHMPTGQCDSMIS